MAQSQARSALGGAKLRKILAVYLAAEAAIHDSLSLVGGVVALLHGVWFGAVLIGWAVVELAMKGLAAILLYHAEG